MQRLSFPPTHHSWGKKLGDVHQRKEKKKKESNTEKDMGLRQ